MGKNTRNKDKTVVIVLMIGAITILNLFTSCSTQNKVKKISSNSIVAIELENGKVKRGIIKDPNIREDVVIKNFIKQWAFLTLNWKTKEKNRVSITDFKTKKDRYIPGNLYAASHALTSEREFNRKFPIELLDLITENLKTDEIESTTKIIYISKPKLKEKGIYDIDLVANWIILEKNKEIAETTFNKRIRVRTIERPPEKIFNEELLGFQKVFNAINDYGLEIIRITPIPKNE